MTRINAKITNHKSTGDLKLIADQIASRIILVDAITDEITQRETTPREHDIIASIALGALINIDRYFEWSIGQRVIQDTIRAAEAQLIAAIFYNMKAFGLTGDSALYVSTYDTLTDPLRRAIRDWANEA